MKKLLNVLYVNTQGVYLSREGETIVAEKDHKAVLRLPIHTLQGVVSFGNVMYSPHLLGLCAERGVNVSMLSEHGRFFARVEGGRSGNVLLRLAQHKAYANKERLTEIARNTVIAKVLNSRNILQRRLRDHGSDAACEGAVTKLAEAVKYLKEAQCVESVRGIEGEAAAVYFGAFNSLITSPNPAFKINGRSRRPPLDPTNALLSFFYVLLSHDCDGALKGVGLDSQIGFLHAPRSGRSSLALDLMEEFRAFLVDRFVLSLINLGQVKPGDFKVGESGAHELKEEPRKAALAAWQKRKQEEIHHPFLNERIPVGMLPHAQALLLARHLRGDLDAYPAFLVK